MKKMSYKKNLYFDDPLDKWRKKILPKYQKIRTNQLIDLIRKNREQI